MTFPRAPYKDTSADWGHVENPVASLKHDGASFYMTVGKDGGLRYFSRRRSVSGDLIERTSQLPQLTKNKLPQFAGNTYNVELVHTGHYRSNDVKEDHPRLSGILNSLPDKSIQRQKEEGPIRAILLDVVNPKINTYGEKLEHMSEVEKAYGHPDVLRNLSAKIGKDAIQDLINKTRERNQEGVIITSLTKPESENTRLKVKHVDTWNLKVKRINQEFDISGNPKKSAGSLTVVDSTGREVADVGTGFSRELRQQIWNNPNEWVGKEIQVKARNPSRHRLIAPVYNGEPDGTMDKVAETLEERLLDTLVAKYKAKGVNLQKILDNPLFQQLPLDKKVAFIEQAGSPLLEKPSLKYGGVGKGVVYGGIGGAIATAMHGAMKGGFPPGAAVPAMVLGAGAGALLGGGAGILRTVLERAQDMKTMEDVSSSSGISTLVNRSGMGKISPTVFGVNKYLTDLEGMIESKVPGVAYYSSDK